jgi:hypothetical protein
VQRPDHICAPKSATRNFAWACSGSSPTSGNRSPLSFAEALNVACDQVTPVLARMMSRCVRGGRGGAEVGGGFRNGLAGEHARQNPRLATASSLARRTASPVLLIPLGCMRPA